MRKPLNRYAALIEQIFFAHYRQGLDAFGFEREELATTAKTLGIALPKNLGDELYVGLNRRGSQFIVPVQAKVGRDQHGVIQTGQAIAFCEERFPHLICRPVSVHALSNSRIAMFELALHDDEVSIVDQKHYTLVPAAEITADDLRQYGLRE